MSWHRLPAVYAGPVVVARLYGLELAHRRAQAGPDAALPSFVECWALIDTGATHSIIDVTEVAARLALRTHDTRRFAVADRLGTESAVHEVGVWFPDFSFPARHVRVSAMRLPGPFWMLVGMDLLEGTRLAMEWRGEERWLRWEPLA